MLSAFDGPRVHLAITLNGVTRTFGSFQAAANEAGLSRIWAGQHTRLDHQAGERLGGQVAGFVLGQLHRARLAHRYVRGGHIIGLRPPRVPARAAVLWPGRDRPPARPGCSRPARPGRRLRARPGFLPGPGRALAVHRLGWAAAHRRRR